MRILIVDDELALLKLVGLMLASSGHEVDLAADGAQAIEKYRASEPNLLICDIFMPKKSGLKAIMDLRREFPEVKVIAMSGGGKTGAEDVLRVARNLGAVDVLKKPFDRETLLAAVDRVAKMPSAAVKTPPKPAAARSKSASGRPKSPRSVDRPKSPRSMERPKSQPKST